MMGRDGAWVPPSSIGSSEGSHSNRARKDSAIVPSLTLGCEGERPHGPIEFQRSAVAVLDLLGFKGVWQRHGVELLLSALSEFAAAVIADTSELIENQASLGQPFDVRVRMFSDTVIFIVTPQVPGPGEPVFETGDRLKMEGRAVLIATLLSAVAQYRATSLRVPFAVRGCIALGDLAMRDPFLVGPAIDAAASGERWADAAVVWLEEGASNALEADLPNPPSRGRNKHRAIEASTHRLEIPGHGPETKVVRVVVPFALPLLVVQDFRRRIESAFGADINVHQKLENTTFVYRQLASAVGLSYDRGYVPQSKGGNSVGKRKKGK